MINRRRKSTRNKLIDAILSEIKKIKIVQFPHCILCGSRQNLQLGHVFSRINKSTIFDLDNNFIQCSNCNNEHESNPLPYYVWVENFIGAQRFHDLRLRTKQIKKWTTIELREMLEDFRRMDKQI